MIQFMCIIKNTSLPLSRLCLSASPWPVVLSGGVRRLWYLAAECGRRLGALVDVGGVQQNLWGWCILLHEALWQPSVSRQSKPQQAEHTHPGPASRCFCCVDVCRIPVGVEVVRFSLKQISISRIKCPLFMEKYSISGSAFKALFNNFKPQLLNLASLLLIPRCNKALYLCCCQDFLHSITALYYINRMSFCQSLFYCSTVIWKHPAASIVYLLK